MIRLYTILRFVESLESLAYQLFEMIECDLVLILKRWIDLKLL